MGGTFHFMDSSSAANVLKTRFYFHAPKPQRSPSHWIIFYTCAFRLVRDEHVPISLFCVTACSKLPSLQVPGLIPNGKPETYI